jgi:aryl-alcohol dehydrogenase-like predicted oxidoreductase
MKYRELGRTGWKVSEVGFGAWAIGGTWGHVSEKDAVGALHKAIDNGCNFIDTADVYGDGLSEQLIAKALGERSDTEEVYVVSKAGRRLDPHTIEGYNKKNLSAFVERSCNNLQVEALDLVQLHCPPREGYYMPELFDTMDGLVSDGKAKFYGVSVEKVEDAIKATEFPNVQCVQIIFNIFRQRPAELFFELAEDRKVAILARVPLASGLLTGKMTRARVFEDDDHRHFNRHGEAFDVGETFSGVDLDLGLEAVEDLRPLVPEGATMAQLALRWTLMFDAVTTVIPGAKNPDQAESNTRASDLPPISDENMARINAIYDEKIRPSVHQRW